MIPTKLKHKYYHQTYNLDDIKLGIVSSKTKVWIPFNEKKNINTKKRRERQM